MLIIFDFLLLSKARVLRLVLGCVDCRRPGAFAVDQGNHFDIEYEFGTMHTVDRIIDCESTSSIRDSKIPTLLGSEMRKVFPQLRIIVKDR
jgi:hypothetical protein